MMSALLPSEEHIIYQSWQAQFLVEVLLVEVLLVEALLVGAPRVLSRNVISRRMKCYCMQQSLISFLAMKLVNVC